MINLTAEEIANIVVNFWDGDSVFKNFVQCETVEEALLIAEILNDEEEKERAVKFFEALRKYIVNFLSEKIGYSNLLIFDVDYSPNETFEWVASTYGVEIPTLPPKHTLILEKSLRESEGKKTLKIILQGKQGYGAFWYRQQYALADSPKV